MACGMPYLFIQCHKTVVAARMRKRSAGELGYGFLYAEEERERGIIVVSGGNFINNLRCFGI